MNVCIYRQALDELTAKQQLRSIPNILHQGQFVVPKVSAINRLSTQEHTDQASQNEPLTEVLLSSDYLINIAGNDYLALGADSELQAEFYDYVYALPNSERPRFGAVSSRLLTGNDEQLMCLEQELAEWYAWGGNSQKNADNTLTKPNKSALVVNSGYHANLGFLPAIAVLPTQTGKTLIVADKLVHASIIDGIQLASLHKNCEFKRYQHNDYEQLSRIISQIPEGVSRIIIVTESVFSMDGDVADLPALVAIKKTDTRVELYLDEAHAVGVFGKTGLGLAQATDTLDDIDYLVGTFGKAFASMGAYVMCNAVVREWLVNSMRPLIYSTALPPLTHAWTRFVLQKMTQSDDAQGLSDMQQRRKRLADISEKIGCHVNGVSSSPIISYVLGSNQSALDKALELQKQGFYAVAIRPPTVAINTARIRLVMNAGLDEATCQRLMDVL